nr:uncharacterized mitochondrial protein AtMg00810-like [Tanacetum cinerariifolium]
YSVNSKAFRVFNSRTRIVQETLHINFLENKPNVAGIGAKWLFDIDTLTMSMNYQPVVAGNQPNDNAGIKENLDACKVRKETISAQQYNENDVYVSTNRSNKSANKKHDKNTKRDDKEKSQVDSPTGVRDLRAEFEEFSFNITNRINAVSAPVNAAGPNPINNTNSFNTASPFVNAVSPSFGINGKSSFVDPFKYLDDPDMPELEDIAYSDNEEDVGVEADLSNLEINIHVSPIQLLESKMIIMNKKDEREIVIRNKARLVAQGHTQEEGIDYDEVFAPVARIEAIRLFLAYASFMGFMVHVDDIIFGSTNKELCKAFENLMNDKFQMSSMGELTFFLGLQVKQKDDGIFISQDKYVAEILRKFGFTYVKSASTPIKTEKHLLKDPNNEDVDVHIYRSMIRSLMYLTSSTADIMFAVCACARFQVTLKVSHFYAVKRMFRYLKGKPHLGLWYPKYSPLNLVAYSDSDYVGASLDKKSTTGGCQFLGCRLISWQCKKQTIVVTSSTEAEYVAAASCCTQVLWIQNSCWTMVLIEAQQISNESPLLGVNTPRCDEDSIELQELMVFMVVVLEYIIRRDLHLDDVDGVKCLPNEEIFEELARMGYEKPPPKLTFYQAFSMHNGNF